MQEKTHKKQSRRQLLLEQIDNCLSGDKAGNVQTRKYRLFVMHRLLDALYEAKLPPPHWHAITSETIQRLVQHLLSHGIAQSTVMNYLVCLRHFLKKIHHEINSIDNVSLGLHKKRTYGKPEYDIAHILQNISDPIAQLLWGSQVLFGLTLSETFTLNNSIHIQEENLWITREISTSSRDRIIPIVNAQQRMLISLHLKLTGTHQCLVKKYGEKHLRLSWLFTLSTLNLPTRNTYRHLYASTRFRELLCQHSKPEAKRIVLSETHISKTSPIWKSIYEQNKAKKCHMVHSSAGRTDEHSGLCYTR